MITALRPAGAQMPARIIVIFLSHNENHSKVSSMISELVISYLLLLFTVTVMVNRVLILMTDVISNNLSLSNCVSFEDKVWFLSILSASSIANFIHNMSTLQMSSPNVLMSWKLYPQYVHASNVSVLSVPNVHAYAQYVHASNVSVLSVPSFANFIHNMSMLLQMSTFQMSQMSTLQMSSSPNLLTILFEDRGVNFYQSLLTIGGYWGYFVLSCLAVDFIFAATIHGKSSKLRDRMATYYDVDDIITEEEIVSVIFQKAASGVGIDPSSEVDFIEAGSKVELPFWLAHELQLRQAVSVIVPPCFNQKTRLEIQADSAGVDLRSRCPFFYEFGCKIAPIVGDRTIGFLLLSAFKSRYKEVLTKAHTAAFAAGSKFWTILTKEEINLYETAQSAMTSFKKWRMGGARFQIASVLGRKRKSTE
ncbi:hypothetical protein VNO77_43782 [Canavalia gladiata]|uniref:GINS subunit domain-containing protein n=1 Tax=Canavalia gladiata TaxID=3824 RepID=A0AAN9PN78_CANGL